MLTKDDELRFEASIELQDLHRHLGNSSFGYRMQAWVANALASAGAKVTAVNALGHPDISARLHGRELLVQVKAVTPTLASGLTSFAARDLLGILPQIKSQDGQLLIVDCRTPLDVYVVDPKRVLALTPENFVLAVLRAKAQLPLSHDLRAELARAVCRNKRSLASLDYRLLVRRALRGDPA